MTTAGENYDRSTAWPCGHTELAPGCDGCGNITANWWAETRRRIAESHGMTVAEFYGE